MIDKTEAKAKFEKDIFAAEVCGIVIEEAAPGYAKCSMTITPDHLNAAGVVMGGAIFTLADYTSAIATNNITEDTVSLSSSIEYMAPGRGERLTAVGRMTKEGRVCFYEVNVTDDTGKSVAKVVGNAYRIKKNI